MTPHSSIVGAKVEFCSDHASQCERPHVILEIMSGSTAAPFTLSSVQSRNSGASGFGAALASAGASSGFISAIHPSSMSKDLLYC